MRAACARVPHPDLQRLRPRGRLLALERGVEDAAPRAGREARHRHVVGDGEGEGEALALAVLAQVADALGEPIGGRGVEATTAGADADAAGLRTGEPEEGPHHLRPPGAHEAEDAEHLAAAEGERGLVEAGGGEAGHVEGDVLGGPALAAGEELAHGAADHEGDELVVGGRVERARPDRPPVAQDGERGRDRPRLLQEVADVDDGHTGSGQPADRREEAVHVAAGQAARGLVHQDDPRPGGDGAADLDDLPRPDGQAPHA